jgi:hypothetical protein
MKKPSVLSRKHGVGYVQSCSNKNAYLQDLNSKTKHEILHLSTNTENSVKSLTRHFSSFNSER